MATEPGPAQPEGNTATPALTSPEELVSCPATGVQKGLWFLDRLEPGRATYNIFTALDLRGDVQWDVLQACVDTLVARHEPLRTSFGTSQGQPVQIIHATASVPIIRVSVHDADDAESEAQRLAILEGSVPFDLDTAPLVRVRAWSIDTRHHVLTVTVHHIISDGWSQVVLFEELSALYAAYAAGHSSPLAPLAIQYADYTVWQERRLASRRDAQLAYWRQTLQTLPDSLDIGTDRPRPSAQSGRGGLEFWTVDPSLSQALRQLCRTENVTLFMAFVAVLKVFLLRHSGQDDLIIGAPVAARPRQELERVVGFFANTLAIRTNLAGNPTFRETLQRVKTAALGAFEHQDVPFFEVVQAAKPERSLTQTPIFQVMCVVQRVPDVSLAFTGVEVRPLPLGNGTAKFDLLVDVQERSDAISASFEFNADCFEAATCRRWIDRIALLLKAVCDDPDRRVDELPIVTEDEMRSLARWNHTTRARDPRDTVVSLFARTAARVPEAQAIVSTSGQHAFSYRQLMQRSGRFARRLRSLGAGSNRLVGVCVDRSISLAVALLGILQAGAAYLPLDPAFPIARLAFMLADSNADLVVTEASMAHLIPGTIPHILLDQELLTEDAHDSVSADLTSPAPGDLAYLLYTSGSTGQPKGVQITHGNLTNLLLSMQHTPGLQATDRLLAVTTISFDIAGVEMFLPLITGATIVLASREEAADAERLSKAVTKSNATVLQATPVTWRMLLDHGWTGKSDLRAFSGGEPMTRDLADRLLARTKEVWNLYGPTETTIYSTGEQIRKDRLITIGRPIDNTQVHVRDRSGRTAPIGVVGELAIGGAGVAQGYLGRPELTADRFVPDPLDPDDSARVYRTGDYGRWLADGRIECLGRLDHQVKVRGFRIELGEIETALNTLSSVQQTVVVARPDASGEVGLAAYVVRRMPSTAPRPAGDDAVEASDTRLFIRQLQEYLHDRLPSYMVPSTLVVLDEMPLTPSGKVDRNALPSPVPIAPDRTSRGDMDEVERTIAAAWTDLLAVTPHPDDDFFAVGGHSLLAARLVSRLARVFQVDVPLATLFDARSVRELAAFVRMARTERSSLEPSDPARFRSLVPIRATGSRIPVMAVHGGAGQVLFYQYLAAGLGDGQPFYGLQAPGGLDGCGPPFGGPKSVEELAEAYLAELRRSRPHGPYVLIGACAGGQIALEMAQRLRREREEVPLLLIFDSWLSNTGLGVSQRLSRHRDGLRALPMSERVPYVMQRLKSTVVYHLRRVQERARALPSLVRRSFAVAQAHRTGAALPQQAIDELFLATSIAMSAQYHPVPYDGSVVLFRSATYAENPSMSAEQVEYMGWLGIATGSFEMIDLPGTHLEMLDPPIVHDLVPIVREKLDRLASASAP